MCGNLFVNLEKLLRTLTIRKSTVMLVEKILFTGYLTGYTGYLTGYIGYISIKTLYMELL